MNENIADNGGIKLAYDVIHVLINLLIGGGRSHILIADRRSLSDREPIFSNALHLERVTQRTEF